GQHALQRLGDGRLVAGGQQVGQVAQRYAQRAHIGHAVAGRDLAGLGGGLYRRKRRHVPHHGQRPVFGVQRKRHLPFNGHLVHGRARRGLQPLFGHAVAPRLLLYLHIVGIQEHAQLRRIQIVRILDGRGLFDAVGVIQHDPQVADAAHAGFGTDGGLAGFDTRITEDALLGFSAGPVVVDFLVRAPGHAHAPAAAFFLVDEHDAVFGPLVDGPRWTRRQAGRVEAMLAQPGQVHHEGLFELPVDFFFDALEVVVVAALFELATQHVFPVAAPFDLAEQLARDQRARPRGGLRLQFGRGLQPFVFKGVGFVEVVDFRQVRIREDFRQDAPLSPLPGHDLAVLAAHPAALPAVLVFPVFGVADARLGFNVVEPDIFHAFAVGPDVFTGDRTGMAADALVQVQHHCNLRAHFHFAASLIPTPRPAVPASTSAASSARLSNQFTLLILRTTTNSSRLAPTVP